MTPQLMILGWTLVLAIVHIMAPAIARTRETGVEYNAGPRDEAGPPVGRVTARLQRAEKNFYETLPLFIAAVLIANLAHRDGALTLWGAGLYLVGRIAYLPIYALGIPKIRSVVWGVALLGLVLILWAILKPE
jgi:uncharacterized MAPEG superfamily protein